MATMYGKRATVGRLLNIAGQAFLGGLCDAGKDARQIGFELSVGKAEHVQTAGLQPPRALHIVVQLAEVHGTIQLDHQAGRMAVEVHDKAIHDLLPAEVQAVELILPELIPQLGFLRSQRAPELPGKRQLGLRDGLPTHNAHRLFQEHALWNAAMQLLLSTRTTGDWHGSGPPLPWQQAAGG